MLSTVTSLTFPIVEDEEMSESISALTEEEILEYEERPQKRQALQLPCLVDYSVISCYINYKDRNFEVDIEIPNPIWTNYELINNYKLIDFLNNNFDDKTAAIMKILDLSTCSTEECPLWSSTSITISIISKELASISHSLMQLLECVRPGARNIWK